MNVSFLQLLALLFIGLKLTDQLDWDWWMVISPMLVEITIFAIAQIHREIRNVRYPQRFRRTARGRK